jgi:beta-N-acetylhexosaminidase
VLDVIGETYSPNIGIRSYGEDPSLVARLGVARIRASQAATVSTCAKHFPGKGHSPLDAHLSLATLDTTEAELRARHLPPFVEAIRAGVHAVMTSHPVYSRLDPVPATFSRRIVTGLLREELGFEGAIVSDDLEMGAITCPVGEAAVLAARAGHDLLLVCHTAKAQREAAAALVRAYRSGELPLAELEAAAARALALRTRNVARTRGGPPRAEPDGAPLAASIAARAVTVVRGPIPRLAGRVGVVFPRFSELAAKITIEPEVLDERAWVERAFAGSDATPEVALVGAVEPTPAEIAAAAALAARGPTLLFLYDARLYPANRALLDAVQSSARSLVVALLRDPWDRDLLAPGTAALTSFGWRSCQLIGIIARLLKG